MVADHCTTKFPRMTQQDDSKPLCLMELVQHLIHYVSKHLEAYTFGKNVWSVMCIHQGYLRTTFVKTTDTLEFAKGRRQFICGSGDVSSLCDGLKATVTNTAFA